MSQFNKTSDRLDRLEKAQAEPAAKLAKLSEAVDKLRAAPPVAPRRHRRRASCGQGSHRLGRAARSACAGAALRRRPKWARLPTVEGWVLRDVANGGALIERPAGHLSKSMPAIPCRASAGSMPSAARTAAGWSSPARA